MNYSIHVGHNTVSAIPTAVSFLPNLRAVVIKSQPITGPVAAVFVSKTSASAVSVLAPTVHIKRPFRVIPAESLTTCVIYIGEQIEFGVVDSEYIGMDAKGTFTTAVANLANFGRPVHFELRASEETVQVSIFTIVRSARVFGR